MAKAKKYVVTASITVSVRCVVEARGPTEAMLLAEDCPVGDIADCIFRHDTMGTWLAEELDGEPNMDESEVFEIKK